MTNHKQRIKQIKQHFKYLTVEEFENNLKKCGEIDPVSDSGWKLQPIEDIILKKLKNEKLCPNELGLKNFLACEYDVFCNCDICRELAVEEME